MMKHSQIWKTAYRFGAMTLAVTLGFASYAAPSQSDVDKIQDKIDQQQDEIDKTQQSIDETEEKKDKLQQAKSEMESYLKKLNQQYSSLESQITKLSKDISAKQAEIEETQAALEEAKSAEEKQYADMKERIQYMYENPRSSFLEMLLEAGSFAGALNRADYAAQIAQYDREMLDSYAAHKAEVQEQEERLEAEKEALDELQASMEKKQQEVSSLASSTSGKISQKVTDIASAQAELDGKNDTLATQQEVLKQLIAEKKKVEAQIEAAKAAEIIGSLGDVTGVRTTELEYTQYAAYSASDEEVKALATLIYCEAGNQGAEGQLAVGAVVMNRIRDSRFGQSDIMSVIRASGQFSPVTSGRFDLMLTDGADSVTESCYNAARRAIAGESNVGNRTFFRTYANYPSLSGLVIGAHIFSYTWNYAS